MALAEGGLEGLDVSISAFLSDGLHRTVRLLQHPFGKFQASRLYCLQDRTTLDLAETQVCQSARDLQMRDNVLDANSLCRTCIDEFQRLAHEVGGRG